MIIDFDIDPSLWFIISKKLSGAKKTPREKHTKLARAKAVTSLRVIVQEFEDPDEEEDKT